MRCEQVTGQLPEFATGRLPGEQAEELRRHLDQCGECAAEAEVIRLLADAPASTPPAGLEARLLTATREAARRRPRGMPTWTLGIAAVFVLALGTPLLMDRMANSTDADPVSTIAENTEVLEDPVTSVWASQDGMIAGAPVIETLTDDELAMLLEEMDG